MNISGVLALCKPESIASTSQLLLAMKGVEIHASQDGKLILTIETENTSQLADAVSSIQDKPGILSVSVIYHHEEQQLDELIDAPFDSTTTATPFKQSACSMEAIS